MIAQPPPRLEVFSDIADLRTAPGTRPPFSTMLAMVCGAMVCGDRSDRAIAAWGRNDGTASAQALGFTQNTPCFQGEQGRQPWHWDKVRNPTTPVKPRGQ